MAYNHLSATYKYSFLLLFSFPFFLFACSSAKEKPGTAVVVSTGGGTIPFDSIQKARIDEIFGEISAGLRNLGMPQKLAFPLYNPADTIYYWMMPDGKSARISIEFKLPNEIRWPTFTVSDGQLIHVRYRQMLDAPPNSKAGESIIYLQDGKIVYCDERGGPLKPGEKPMSIQLKGYSKSTRSYAEIEQDYKTNWELVYDYMKKNNVLPASFKK